MLTDGKTIRVKWQPGGAVSLIECHATGDTQVVPTTNEVEFAASLQHADLTAPVPTPSDTAEVAARWVKSPEVMLKELTDELNGVLDICEVRHVDDLVFQIKREILAAYESSKQGNSGRMVPVDVHQALKRFPAEIVILSLFFSHLQKCVDLVNSIQPTPFSGDVIRNMNRRLYSGDTLEFDLAIKGWWMALQQLAEWIRVRQLLHGKLDFRPGIVPPRSYEVEEAQRILANDPRTEVIRQIITDHPDWIEGNRDAILTEVKERYTNPETGRRGINRGLGLQIVKCIVNGEI